VSQESVPPSAAPKTQIALRTFVIPTPFAKHAQVIVSVTFFRKNVLAELVPLSVVVLMEPRTVPTAIFVTQRIALLVVVMEIVILLLRHVKLESVPLFHVVKIHNAPIRTIAISLIAYAALVTQPLHLATQVVDFVTIRLMFVSSI
jgi:hypothetical protein